MLGLQLCCGNTVILLLKCQQVSIMAASELVPVLKLPPTTFLRTKMIEDVELTIVIEGRHKLFLD